MSRRANVAARVAAVVLGLALVVTGAKLITMVWLSSSGAAAYADGDYLSAERSFDRLEVLNVVEPWRAPFGRGDALYRIGNLVSAGAEFGDALELAPERCEIRFNLAVTIEAVGDAMIGNRFEVEELENESPLERYRTALDVIGAGFCPDDEPDGPGARLEEARRRLIEKLGGEQGDLPAPDIGNDPSEQDQNQTSTRSATEELEQRNQAGAQQRDLAREVGNQDYELSPQSEW